ncbi:outer envelope pore protein 16-2, chloroplastic-like isoform X2 [Prosopis cineraria]|uniref:outer envelope pore protein 16-2, chloroplastic-like isoform X2 n=1 Tax=Prosopis cineraria TaxID=364024 RepID=UPI0024103A7A|nr:outer envelope pore protein 16-2, chloroplastic-like isoform X2 [Prosopis cineraria]
MSSSNLDSRSLMQELRSFDNEVPLFDFGHPLLNRVSNSFLKAAAIGAVQAVAREAYFTAVEGAGIDNASGIVPDVSDARKARFPGLGGLAAGLYSGLTYGLKEARGVHDWKNSAVVGALTGATLALTSENSSHEKIVQSAITGAAVSAAANLLSWIF